MLPGHTLTLPIADDFIDIHVALSPRASLPDYKGKMIIQFAIMNLESEMNSIYIHVLQTVMQL